MKEKFVNKSIALIAETTECDEEKTAKLRYGLESLYISITKLVVLFILAILLGIFKEFILTLLFFNVIRFPAFGFHAGNSTVCLIFSTIVFVGVPLLFSIICPNIYCLLVIEVISSLILLIYAPADTVKRPLPNKKKRKIRKLATVIIAILYTTLSIILKLPIANMLCGALLIEAIMVNPITYKLFKQPYNNYLNYKMA